MSMILDGKVIAQQLRAELASEVSVLTARGVHPGLAVVLVGDDHASRLYVRNKTRACAAVGIKAFDHALPSDTRMQDLLRLVEGLNADPAVHGILVQLPLPGGLDASRVIEAIRPDKDVDGFHPQNLGRLVAGLPGLVACTPLGILELIRRSGLPLPGARAVVVGRSLLVGKPTALLLLHEHCTVSLCHSRTRDLPGILGEADLLVAAIGRPRFIRGEWLKPGAVVIDVGINRQDDHIVGDVEYEAAAERASAITPVPGGVGPMTIAMLLRNTVQAARQQALNHHSE